MRQAAETSPQPRTWTYRLASVLCFSAFFGGALYLLFEIRWLEATFDAAWLVSASLALAALTYVVLRPGLNRLFDALGDEAWAGRAMVVVGLSAATVAGASSVNRRTAREAPDTQSFAVLDKRHKARRPRAPERWDVVIDVDGDRERIEVTRERWESVGSGGTIDFAVVRGGLGFSFVDRSN